MTFMHVHGSKTTWMRLVVLKKLVVAANLADLAVAAPRDVWHVWVCRTAGSGRGVRGVFVRAVDECT